MKPTNMMKCVEWLMMLDAAAPIAKRTWSIYVRSEIFDKGVFLFMTEDGGLQIVKLQ